MRIWQHKIIVHFASEERQEIVEIEMQMHFHEMASLHNNYNINKVYYHQQFGQYHQVDGGCLLFLYQKYRHNAIDAEKKEKNVQFKGFSKYSSQNPRKENVVLENREDLGGQSYIWPYMAHKKAIVDVPGKIFSSFILHDAPSVLTVISSSITFGRDRRNFVNNYYATHLIIEGTDYRSFTVHIRELSCQLQVLNIKKGSIACISQNERALMSLARLESRSFT